MVLVRDVMKSRDLAILSPSSSVRDAVELMSKMNVGSILVVDEEGKPRGIFTERDLVHHLAKGGSLEAKLGDVMTRRVVTIKEDETVWKAITLMVEHGIRHLPVVDEEGKIRGVISARDALRILVASVQWP